MKEYAVINDFTCQLQIEDPDSGRWIFAAYRDWPAALTGIELLQSQRRHAFEIIQHGKPCKPYLDIDGKRDHLPARFADTKAVVLRVEELVVQIFREDYGITLQLSDFAWSYSQNPDKLSLHLAIATHGPQYVYRSNHQTDPQGALHLPMRLIELDADLASIVDVNVYTKDRAMRMVGSSKFGKSSILRTFTKGGHKPSDRDTIISWLDSDIKFINVPCATPYKRGKSVTIKAKTIREFIKRPRLERDSKTEAIILELLRNTVHPTAYRTVAGEEDLYDSDKGVRFNFTDRSEKCYTGTKHHGNNNFKAWIDNHGEVWMRCYSANCVKKSAHHVGRLSAEFEHFRDEAITINSQYLSRVPKTERPVLLDETDIACDEITRFNTVIDDWIDEKFKVLCIRSPMGSGKSYLLTSLIEELPPTYTILALTYRQTLAYNLHDKLPKFHNYLDGGDLWDREAYPCIICQLDSFPKLTHTDDELPIFDFIILDEIESLLNHFSSKTLRNPARIMDMLLLAFKHAKHIVIMDALWGQQTYDFLKQSDIAFKLIINQYVGTTRTFKWHASLSLWYMQIRRDIDAGRNIVIPSLSAQAMYDLKADLLAKTDLSEDAILIHTSKQDDDVKKSLISVNSLWSKYRLVMYSPTIEAGVDFTAEHFDKMYVYVCANSTTHLGLFQMTGRVRNLKTLDIFVVAQKGVSIGHADLAHVTVAEQMDFLQWIDRQAIKYLPLVDYKGQDGRVHILPLRNQMFTVTAHNEARRVNAEHRFYLEFKELAEKEGHKLEVFDTERGPKRYAPEQNEKLKAYWLIHGHDLSDEEFAAMHEHVCASNATGIDKWLCYKHQYKAAWGIDNVSPEFVEANGTEMSCDKLHMCMRILFPYMMYKDHAAPAERIWAMKIAYVNEVLRAIGWQHMFDSSAAVLDDFKDRLLKTEMFTHYSKNIQLFDTRGKADKHEWSNHDIRKSLDIILGSAGIGVISTELRCTDNDGKRYRKYTYYIDQEQATRMANLINLKRRSAICLVPGAAEFLNAKGYGAWSDAVDAMTSDMPDIIICDDDTVMSDI